MSDSPAALPRANRAVLTLGGTDRLALAQLLGRYGVDLVLTAPGQLIPGSYWGEAEAGLKGAHLYARLDTPVHSVLHEASHFICMTPERRAQLDRDAGGNDDEESAVCYLQVLLAGELPGVGCARLMDDMDAWGYTFRLGNTRAWFETDAEGSRQWLERVGIITVEGLLTGALRI